MKYEAPNADVIDLRAMESVALLDGHPDEKTRPATRDALDGGFSIQQGTKPF